MADPTTKFVTNDPLTRKKWAKDLFRMPAQADLDFLSEVGDQSFTPAVDIDDFSGIEDQLNQITQDEIEDDAFLKTFFSKVF